MKIKKTPLRMCMVTRDRFPKNELIRIVRTPEGEVLVDDTSKMNGKGAYLKKDIEVVNKAKNNNVIGRFLEIEIPLKVYDEIIDTIKK